MKTRILLAATVFVVPLFLATGPADETAGHGGRQNCQALLTPAMLPHTADAIEAWFRACHEQQAAHPATADETAGHRGRQSCQALLTPAMLPHTPDAIEAWFRACYERQGD